MLMFQSTRPHGARRGTLAASYIYPCFNPRARMGRDCLRQFQCSALAVVSIHAPAWGATRSSVSFSDSRGRFNPRARMGRDTEATANSKYARMFQSTRPHGARPSTCCHLPPWSSFNPRARMGRDWSGHVPHDILGWFQSTRPHGARLNSFTFNNMSIMFQSTRPHGARLI